MPDFKKKNRLGRAAWATNGEVGEELRITQA